MTLHADSQPTLDALEPADLVHDFTDDELAIALPTLFAELRDLQRRLALHNRDGFFAEEAGSDACLALGHQPNPDMPLREQWVDVEGHEYGYTDWLCSATKYGQSCTYCEGECIWPVPPRLWALPNVTGEAR